MSNVAQRHLSLSFLQCACLIVSSLQPNQWVRNCTRTWCRVLMVYQTHDDNVGWRRWWYRLTVDFDLSKRRVVRVVRTGEHQRCRARFAARTVAVVIIYDVGSRAVARCRRYWLDESTGDTSDVLVTCDEDDRCQKDCGHDRRHAADCDHRLCVLVRLHQPIRLSEASPRLLRRGWWRGWVECGDNFFATTTSHSPFAPVKPLGNLDSDISKFFTQTRPSMLRQGTSFDSELVS